MLERINLNQTLALRQHHLSLKKQTWLDTLSCSTDKKKIKKRLKENLNLNEIKKSFFGDFYAFVILLSQ